MRTVLAVALCLAAFAATAQVYRWTDEKGRVHITDSPPPPAAKNVRKSAVAPAAEPSGPEPFQLQQARKNFPIKLYTTPGCDPCTEARKMLNARGLPFTEVSVQEEAQMQELKQATGSATVPTMVVGKTVQRGFEAGAYERMLDAAGYPKMGDLPPRSQPEPKALEPGAPEVKPVEPAEGQPLGPYSPDAPPQPKPAAKAAAKTATKK